jgi:hypothetical protein
MALIRNGANLYPNTYRHFSAIGAHAILSAVGVGNAKRNWHAGWHTVSGVTNRSGLPDGYRPPSCWMMGQKTGGLSSRNESNFAIDLAALTLAEGRNIAGDITFAITLPDAALQLIVSATGTTTITFTDSSTLAGALAAAGTGDFAFTVPNATLGAIVNAIATGAITFTGAGTPRAVGTLEGDITPFTTLSPENLAANVWSSIIESGYTAGQIMQVLSAVAAGKTDIDGTDVTFRDINDTADRVFASMTGSERTTVTLTVD